eukprot:12408268-Karenia_brevis.AAC.1
MKRASVLASTVAGSMLWAAEAIAFEVASISRMDAQYNMFVYGMLGRKWDGEGGQEGLLRHKILGLHAAKRVLSEHHLGGFRAQFFKKKWRDTKFEKQNGALHHRNPSK